MCNGDLGRQMPSFWTSLPLPPPFAQFYVLSMTPYGRECSFGQVGITPSCVWDLSLFCAVPGWWSEVRSRKALASMCKHLLSSNKNISVLPALQHKCTSTKQSPVFAAMKKITPCQPKPVQGDVLVITRLLWCSYDEVCLKSQKCTQIFVTTKANVVTAVFLVWGFFGCLVYY